MEGASLARVTCITVLTDSTVHAQAYIYPCLSISGYCVAVVLQTRLLFSQTRIPLDTVLYI